MFYSVVKHFEMHFDILSYDLDTSPVTKMIDTRSGEANIWFHRVSSSSSSSSYLMKTIRKLKSHHACSRDWIWWSPNQHSSLA